MQVNSAQDYLTQVKRQIVAKSLALSPPPLKQRSNTQYIGILANKSDQYDIFVAGIGINSVGPATLGKTYRSFCCVPLNTSTRTYLV
jgi:hypothetical protein